MTADPVTVMPRDPTAAWKQQQAEAKERDVAERRAAAAARFNATVLTTGQIANLPPPEWLVADYLVRDSLALLYGPAGTAKTFLGLDWALHVATGSWWNGHEVKAGGVLYVIAEGARGIGRRVASWQQHHRIYSLDSFHDITWQPRAVNFGEADDIGGLILHARETRPALVIFDTLARCSNGLDENSSKDAGLVVSRLDHIRANTGACVLVIHHSGKDGANGARGSSALRAAVDTELEVTAVDHRLTLRVTKQKDGEESRPLRLDRMSVDGTDSCVLVPAGRGPITDEIPSGATSTLEALRSVELPTGIPAGQWQEVSEVSRRSFFTHRKLLLDRGLVKNVGTDRQPRYVTVEGTDEGL